MKKTAIVIGSGAGGATAARELQGSFNVTVIEAGGSFRPFAFNLRMIEALRYTGMIFDERMIGLLFPPMKVRKTPDGTVIVNGNCIGGTTTLSAGNAIRADGSLKKLGIDLDREFEEIYREIPTTTDHRRLWSKTTCQLFDIADEMGLAPVPIPKFGNYSRCVNCGKCVLGCSRGAKWDSRVYLKEACAHGAKLISKWLVENVVIKSGRATGVFARRGLRRRFYPADLIVIAAGGLGTPMILENSGIKCEQRLFVDHVLTVAAEWKNCRQSNEISMPFVVQKEHFIISPYFDHLSFFFNRKWRHASQDILGIMIKLADENEGGIENGRINKVLSKKDEERLRHGAAICCEMLMKLGIEEKNIFLGTVNAGHPGGMFPLTEQEAETFHNGKLPENLYVADASLFPTSLGNPPILTIIAMAKRVCSIMKAKMA
jgi:choline dehydrogenase-like flavoprotein